jgi:hypothetical protein
MKYFWSIVRDKVLIHEKRISAASFLPGVNAPSSRREAPQFTWKSAQREISGLGLLIPETCTLKNHQNVVDYIQ